MKSDKCRFPRLAGKRALTICAILLAVPATAIAAEPTNLELIQTIELTGGGSGKFDHLALNSSNSHLYIADKSNNTLDIVDLKAGKLMKMIPDQKKISGVAFAPDLKMLAVGNGEGVLKVYAVPSYKLTYSRKFPGSGQRQVLPHEQAFLCRACRKETICLRPGDGRSCGRHRPAGRSGRFRDR